MLDQVSTGFTAHLMSGIFCHSNNFFVDTVEPLRNFIFMLAVQQEEHELLPIDAFPLFAEIHGLASIAPPTFRTIAEAFFPIQSIFLQLRPVKSRQSFLAAIGI